MISLVDVELHGFVTACLSLEWFLHIAYLASGQGKMLVTHHGLLDYFSVSAYLSLVRHELTLPHVEITEYLSIRLPRKSSLEMRFTSS